MDPDQDLVVPFQNMVIADNTQLNILLLGETGVGKSTFINSVVNYLHFAEIEEAKDTEKLTVLIPAKFSIPDKNNKQQSIEIGESSDKNEYISNGQSATQDAKSYLFPIPNELGRNGKMRFLDTPGMGDTRGIEQDDINCENILSFIAKYDQIHAICILLKPNNTRLTPAFVYCIKKILSHLDKSAANNIIFAFTNSRASNYTPGDTQTCLQEIIKEVQRSPPYVKIPFDENVFCFDNEGFRCLAALKKNVEISDMAYGNAVLSWEQSSRECAKMIHYVSSLKPHEVNNIVSINEARKSIWQLSKPLADITELIDNKIRVMERHQDVLNDESNGVEDLRANLYIPVVNIRVKELSQPVTVCTNKECTDTIAVECVQSVHYKARCHNPCYLQNVTKEIVGDTELKNCWAMENDQCKVCGCSYKVHMHIYYETETYSDKVINENIKNNISSKEGVIREKEKLTKEIKKMVRELQQEQNYIATTNAMFAHFLQNNAIAPFNDAYKEYIEHLINNEKSLGKAANMNVIYRWQQLSAQHDQIKLSFDDALKRGDPDLDLTPYGIQDNIKKLFSLRHTGANIKQLFESQKKSLRKERENMEYVHTAPIKNSMFKKIKNKVTSYLGGRSNTKQENISNANIQQTPSFRSIASTATNDDESNDDSQKQIVNQPVPPPGSQFNPNAHQFSYNFPPNFTGMQFPPNPYFNPMYYPSYFPHPNQFPGNRQVSRRSRHRQDVYPDISDSDSDDSESRRKPLPSYPFQGEDVRTVYNPRGTSYEVERQYLSEKNRPNNSHSDYYARDNDYEYHRSRLEKSQYNQRDRYFDDNRIARRPNRDNSNFEYEDFNRRRDEYFENNSDGFQRRYSLKNSAEYHRDHLKEREDFQSRNPYERNEQSSRKRDEYAGSLERPDRIENMRFEKQHDRKELNKYQHEDMRQQYNENQRDRKEFIRYHDDRYFDGRGSNVAGYDTVGAKARDMREGAYNNMRQYNEKEKHRSYERDMRFENMNRYDQHQQVEQYRRPYPEERDSYPRDYDSFKNKSAYGRDFDSYDKRSDSANFGQYTERNVSGSYQNMEPFNPRAHGQGNYPVESYGPQPNDLKPSQVPKFNNIGFNNYDQEDMIQF